MEIESTASESYPGEFSRPESSPSRTPLPHHLRLETAPAAYPESVVTGATYRFTVLTSRMIRLEYNAAGQFEDRASQLAVVRAFDRPEFRVVDDPDHLQIITEHVHLSYDKRPFSANGLTIAAKGAFSAHKSLWRFSVAGRTLGGTARTLDDVDGAVPLEPGLMSREGYSVLDDSTTLLIDEDGWFAPRHPESQDLYYFGYGHDYRQCLRDFYALTGPTPLLPRFALGNWWSRYWAYSQDEYTALIERFEAESIPFSVAVVDMDWHVVDVDARFGSGWTGYTWNTSLFPDPDAFAAWLHTHGLRLTLNVHPADGVQAHEGAYRDMALALGVDPATEDPIAFDVTDPAFMLAYFEHLHHPLEQRGVDFWWLDWQSGSHSKIVGLDPLWVLGHLHFLDSARDGKQPLTFSRYSGPGSHRYPIGFSGDTVVSWESLHFQPYFTATASNIGYGWWSHDIGGHLGGGRDDDLAVRWTQFGVFSPIMRLHSTSGRFNGKEPWRYSAATAEIMGDFLRLRHALVPYLHTMNHRAAAEGQPLVQPMYYAFPEIAAAYEVSNQYAFGSELIVCPITTALHPRLKRARVKAWLPGGTWIDFFTGLIYEGDRLAYLHRTADTIPVLARAGAIVPLSDGPDGTDAAANPRALEIRAFAGADGTFDLIEDAAADAAPDAAPDAANGATPAAPPTSTAHTRLELRWSAGDFIVCPVTGDSSVVPELRQYTVAFVGFAAPSEIVVTVSGRPVSAASAFDPATNTTTVSVAAVTPLDEVRFSFADGMRLATNDVRGRVLEIITDALIDFAVKDAVLASLSASNSEGADDATGGSRSDAAAVASGALIASRLQALDLDPILFGAVLEIVAALPGRQGHSGR